MLTEWISANTTTFIILLIIVGIWELIWKLADSCMESL